MADEAPEESAAVAEAPPAQQEEAEEEEDHLTKVFNKYESDVKVGARNCKEHSRHRAFAHTLPHPMQLNRSKSE